MSLTKQGMRILMESNPYHGKGGRFSSKSDAVSSSSSTHDPHKYGTYTPASPNYTSDKSGRKRSYRQEDIKSAHDATAKSLKNPNQNTHREAVNAHAKLALIEADAPYPAPGSLYTHHRRNPQETAHNASTGAHSVSSVYHQHPESRFAKMAFQGHLEAAKLHLKAGNQELHDSHMKHHDYYKSEYESKKKLEKEKSK